MGSSSEVLAPVGLASAGWGWGVLPGGADRDLRPSFRDSGSRGSFARATLRISVRPAPPRCGLFTASFLTACARQGLIVQGNSVVGAAVAYAMDLVYVAARMGAAGAGCGLLGAVFFLDQEALAGSLQGDTRTRV